MARIEPNQRDIIGFSFDNEEKRAKWIDLVKTIANWVEDNDLAHSFVFHGTSSKRAADILEDGMKPTDITHAISEGSLNDTGSFWGDIYTASAYAEDTIKERDPGYEPVLLIARTAELEEEYDLRPDLATLDFPLKGLTKLEDKELADDWINHHSMKTWPQGLSDLGAIIAIHDGYLDPAYMKPIKSKADFEEISRLLRAEEATLFPVR